MNIFMLNGSPKSGESFSGILLDIIEKEIKEKNPGASTNKYKVYKPLDEEELIKELITCDAIIIAFPLYVDGIPSNMLDTLHRLDETLKKTDNRPYFYGIVNNGFNESFQDKYAIEIMHHFVERSGLKMGQCIAISAGEAARTLVLGGLPIGKGPLAPLENVLDDFTNNIISEKNSDNIYCDLIIPKAYFMFFGNHCFWNAQAKKNGLTVRQMNKRLEL